MSVEFSNIVAVIMTAVPILVGLVSAQKYRIEKQNTINRNIIVNGEAYQNYLLAIRLASAESEVRERRIVLTHYIELLCQQHVEKRVYDAERRAAYVSIMDFFTLAETWPADEGRLLLALGHNFPGIRAVARERQRRRRRAWFSRALKSSSSARHAVASGSMNFLSVLIVSSSRAHV